MILTYWKFGVGGFIGFLLAWGIQSFIIDGIEAKHKEALAAQVIFDITQCSNSKQPAKEANNESEKNNTDLLNQCLSKLHKPAKCVHVSRTPGSAETAANADTGLTSAAIEEHNILCRKAVNDLNIAKTWGAGYEKFQGQISEGR
jgi:hypothetical protein